MAVRRCHLALAVLLICSGAVTLASCSEGTKGSPLRGRLARLLYPFEFIADSIHALPHVAQQQQQQPVEVPQQPEQADDAKTLSKLVVDTDIELEDYQAPSGTLGGSTVARSLLQVPSVLGEAAAAPGGPEAGYGYGYGAYGYGSYEEQPAPGRRLLLAYSTEGSSGSYGDYGDNGYGYGGYYGGDAEPSTSSASSSGLGRRLMASTSSEAYVYTTAGAGSYGSYSDVGYGYGYGA